MVVLIDFQREREEQRPKADRHQDDGDAPVAERDVVVEEDEERRRGTSRPAEEAEVDDVRRGLSPPPACARTSRSLGPKKAMSRYVAERDGRELLRGVDELRRRKTRRARRRRRGLTRRDPLLSEELAAREVAFTGPTAASGIDAWAKYWLLTAA